MRKALSTTDLLAKKYDLIEWDDEWAENFSFPEDKGVWSVSGQSTNGKTGFLLQLAKALIKATNKRVLFNSLEEGGSKTLQDAWIRESMVDCGRKIQVIKEDSDELNKRLEKRESPEIVIFDTFQYTNYTWREYLALKAKFYKKLFIFNQQMDGNKIMGKTGIRVNYDADLKIWVQGFKAFSRGRYIGENWENGYTIWEKGAKKYWTKQPTNNE